MAYRWKPSASQRKAFASNMKDPGFAKEYQANKDAKAAKKRAGSQFDYGSAGGEYIPTQAQYHFVAQNHHLAVDSKIQDAFNQVSYGYTCNEKIHHDYIHIVNELIRSQH